MDARLWIVGLCLWVAVFSVQAEEGWIEIGERHGVRPEILYAIALAESRYADESPNLVQPWPWTIRSAEHGTRYFDTYDEALGHLRQVLSEGIRNVDVGLMQINWKANSHRLPDPAELLKPQRNIDVGAAVLSDAIKSSGGDMLQGIGRYHSPTPKRATRYANTVQGILDRMRAIPGFVDRNFRAIPQAVGENAPAVKPVTDEPGGAS